MNLEGKVVLITGSSRGMGAASARLAASRGAKVVLHGRTESEELIKLSDELGVMSINCDVSDKQAVKHSVDLVIKQYGKIDVLINCAGYVKSKPFLDLEDSDWYADFNINVLGSANFCQLVIPQMNKGGSIVNVSSIRGLSNLARIGAVPYCVSKAGVISLTVALAKEYGPTIRVNCVAPGPTETDMAKYWPPEIRKKYETESLLDKIPTPEEMAKIILFLASDESGIMTGQVLTADTGYTIYGK